MQIKYLGTAACEGVPAIFCDCETCKRARLAGGKNIRTRSQAIIDNKILIDFSADTYMHSLNYGIELSRIHTCLITHNHEDHLYAEEIVNRKVAFAYPEEGPLDFYVTYPAYRTLIDQILQARMDEQERVRARRIRYFETFEAEGYQITPLMANHDPQCDPVIYIIQHQDKAMLYAHDTGIFPEETWDYLSKNPVKMNFVSLDCTHGINETCLDGHMGLQSDKEVRQRLVRIGCADEDTLFAVNHFSHNGLATYDELVPIAAKEHFVVSYDGMSIDF